MAAREALALYGGELLPEDRYEEWAEERREQLRLRHLDLLRLDGRWETVIELDPSDELAHLALMRRHAANGDRHAALRQFERMDRTLRRELGVAPGREALALRDRLLAEHDVAPRRDDALIGRDRELAIAEHALLDSAGRAQPHADRQRSGRRGQVVAARRHRPHGRRSSASGSVTGRRRRSKGRGRTRRSSRRSPTCAGAIPTLLDGLPDHHREEIDRALAGAEIAWTGESSHQRLFVAAAELVRLASATNGLLLTIDDVHDADDASLRLLHYIARSTRDQRVCIVLTHRPAPISDTLAETRQSLIDRHGAIELELGPLGDDDIAALVRRHVAEPDAGADRADRGARPGHPVRGQRARPPRGQRAAVGAGARRQHDRRHRAGDARGAAARRRRRLVVRHRRVRRAVRPARGRSVRPSRRRARRADRRAGEHRLPVPPRSRARRAARRRAAAPAPPDPSRRRQPPDRAATRRRRASVTTSSSPVPTADAVPYLLRAAETEAAVGAYRDALVLVDAVRPHATGAHRATALSLRGDLLNAIGDPMAVVGLPGGARRRRAGDRFARLRVRLARSAVMSGDLETTAAALDGLDTDGGADDADILLARGKYALFTSDFDVAQAASEEAQRLVLAGERNWKVLDLVALQGLLAHRSGNWFDRMRLELRRTRENPEIANAIFDGYLCPAEYMLYGPTPYAEVIDVARDLQTTARRSGALRAAAFASALIGEAALLSGDLELAAAELTEAGDLHHDLGSAGRRSALAAAARRGARGRRRQRRGDAAAAAGAAAGALVDDRQASAATRSSAR